MSQKTVKLVFAGTFLIALLGFVRVLSERNVWDRWSVTQTGAKVAEDRGETGEPGSEKEKKRIILDPGHGGFDPGKVGTLPDGTQVPEKVINLKVAKKLAAYLEANDYQVMLTRTEDQALELEGQGSKKAQDLKARVAMIEENHPSLVVSIHQNSFPQAKIKGAQVFYYQTSQEGFRLATSVQDSLRNLVEPENHRQVKPNNSYYLLKHVSAPIVIVECGFLSNPQECELLTQEEYISRVAWAIAMGIIRDGVF